MQNAPIRPFMVGKTRLDGNIFLGPMAGYTDIPFRGICIRHGADLTYTEMVSAEGLFRDSDKTEELMRRAPEEKNYVIQIFLSDTRVVPKTVEKIKPYQPAMIDINCGCPVPKVTKNGCGSALMKTPEKIREIVHALKEETDIPVSVKFRLGWDENHINFLEFADAAAQGGAMAMTLHTRTRTQGYAPFAHKERLKELTDYRLRHWPDVRIIASGDLFTAKDVVDDLTTYDIDAAMVARGAIGNPFIFEDAKRLAQGLEPEPLTPKRRVEALLEHLDGMIGMYTEPVACRLMRKNATFYLRGMHGAHEARMAFNQAESKADYQRICASLTAETVRDTFSEEGGSV